MAERTVVVLPCKTGEMFLGTPIVMDRNENVYTIAWTCPLHSTSQFYQRRPGYKEYLAIGAPILGWPDQTELQAFIKAVTERP